MMLLFDYNKFFGEEWQFLWKISIFGNFAPQGAAEDLEIF